MSIIGLSEVITVTAELGEVEVRKVPCGTFAGTLNRRVVLHNGGYLALDTGDQRGGHVFVMYHLPDNTKWIVDNEIPHPRSVPVDSSPMQMVFLLSNTRSAPVEVELQETLNRLS